MAEAPTYSREHVIYDADSHLMETKNWLHDYADPDVRPLLGPLNLSAFPDPAFVPEYTPDYYEKGWSTDKAKDAEAHLWERKLWGALGAVDPVERSVALDKFGFQRQIVFATFCWGQFDTLAYAPTVTGRDPKLLYGGSRAHNRGVAEFCRGDDRLLPTGMVPLDDPELAIAMTEELLNDGCRGIVIPTGIMEERSWSHPDYDPMWARMSEANVPIVLHVGTGNFPLPKSMYNTGKPLVYMMAGRGIDTGNESGWVLQDLLSTDYTIKWFLAAMINDGVFARHENLKCVVTEYQFDWVPWFGERLDTIFAGAMMWAPDAYRMPMKPSEYFVERVRHAPLVCGVRAEGSAMDVPDLGAVIDKTPSGERLFLFSSDYPHAEGGTDPLGALEASLRSMGDRAPEAMRLIMTDNFIDTYGR